MYVISRGGHLGLWWEGDKSIFIENDSWVFVSRGDCLEYLEKIHGRERAVDIILSLKKSKGTLISF
jgi:hypothetical protein